MEKTVAVGQEDVSMSTIWAVDAKDTKEGEKLLPQRLILIYKIKI